MKKKILVIDDNHTLTSLMDYILSSEGFQVLSSNLGEEGLKHVYSYLPDLIILDWIIPDLSGEKILNKIKKEPQISSIPIFLLSGLADNINILQYDVFTDIKIIEKPFDHDLLVKMIHEKLG